MKQRKQRTPKGPPTKWESIYILVSHDAKEIALVAMSETPMRFQDFISSVDQWIETMKKNALNESSLIDDDGEFHS